MAGLDQFRKMSFNRYAQQIAHGKKYAKNYSDNRFDRRYRPGNGPAIIAVNPGSMLGSKMVKDAFGVAGGDLNIGADILSRAALSDEFSTASGQYFDNDSGQFVEPHRDTMDPQKCAAIVAVIERLLK